MSVIFIVVPLATLVVLVAVIAFVVSARRGQFDDLDTPAVRTARAIDEPNESVVIPSEARNRDHAERGAPLPG